jgi:AcrR family transcriptional regulator
MSRKVVRNERRIQILEALHKCLLEKPFHQTTIQDIAKKANVNQSLLHYHFENKEDILLNYIEYTFNKYHTVFVERFIRKFGKSAINMETFEEQCRWVLHEAAFNQESAKIFTEIWALALYNSKVMRKLRDYYQEYKAELIVLIKNFVNDEATATRLSLTLIAFFEGMSLLSIIFNKKDLCTDINFSGLLKSLAPESEIRFP